MRRIVLGTRDPVVGDRHHYSVAGCVPRNLEGAIRHTRQGIRWALIPVCRQAGLAREDS